MKATDLESFTWRDDDLRISRLCFGCEQLGGTDWGNVDDGEMAAAIELAIDLGINVFDTAAVYGLGQSERRLSAVLGERRHEYVIATKVGYEWKADQPGRAATSLEGRPDRVKTQVRDSLSRLRLDVLPLCYVHRPDPKIEVERTIEALREEQLRGRIQRIGCSNFSLSQLERAETVGHIDAVQLEYNCLDRSAETKLLPYCHEHGIAVFVYGSLARGLLTGKVGRETKFPASDRRHRLPAFHGRGLENNLRIVDRVVERARTYGKSPSQYALRWVLDHGAVSCAIAGIKSSKQIAENVGALGWQVDSKERRLPTAVAHE